MANTRMNVGILIPGFSANVDDWSIPVQQNLVREMAKQATVRVIATRYPHTRQPYMLDGAHIYPLGAGAWARGWQRLKLWLETLNLLRRLHAETPFDVLHAMWSDETGALAAWAGKWLNTPVVVSIAGGELVGFDDIVYGLQRSRFSRWTVNQALHGADAVIVACDYVKRLALKHNIPATKIYQIALGVDTNVFMPDSNTRIPGHDLVHVASLVGVKDQTTLFEAIAHLEGVTLNIVGEGPERPRLDTLAQALKIDNRVTFSGKVHHLDLPEIYRSASLNVLTSRHEGLGMVTLEAAACGVPTISTEVGLLPDVPEMGVCVPVGDSYALAKAIHTLLNDDARREVLGRSAIETVNKHFSIQHTVEAFLALYAALRD